MRVHSPSKTGVNALLGRAVAYCATDFAIDGLRFANPPHEFIGSAAFADESESK
jgi:hypothetical protein